MTETIFSPREMVILIPSQTNTQMVAHKEGREKTISFERIFSISKIHYTLGCLVLAFFFGPPGAVFLAYIQTKNVSDAIVASVSLFFGLELPFWPGVFGLAIFTVILFYCTYLIQDMRLKLLAAKKDILPILPGGDEAFDKAFAHVSNSWPPLALGAIVGILVTFDCYTSYLKYGIALPSLVFIVFFSFIWAIVAGTFLWIFFSSIWGVHKLGRDHIKLRHYSEEKTLGAKPIGLLSLSHLHSRILLGQVRFYY